MKLRTEALLKVEDPARRERAGNLADLYRRHCRDAYRFAHLLTGDHSLAEDLVQDAFVRLGGRFANLREPERFEGYLYRTILNRVRSRWRHQRVQDRYVRSEEVTQQAVKDPSSLVLDRDLLWRAMLTLPERQRAILFLRYFRDLSEAQSADALDCTVSAVKSLTQRAMKKLRHELEVE